MSFVFRSLVAWTPVFLPAALGLGATFLADGYSIRIWQTEDGLPQNLVTSAVQTHDGYLWFGRHSGLARFDGERLQIFVTVNTSELADSRISNLFEDAHGTLRIGQASGMITRYRNHQFEAAPPAPRESAVRSTPA